MSYQVRITEASGEVHLHALNKSEVIIGSDLRSDICVGGESKLLPNHILLAPGPDQCWVSTSKGAPLWDSEGQAVEGGFVPWGSRLSLGGCVFELHGAEIAIKDHDARNPQHQGADKPSESSKTANPIFIMLLLSALAYLGLGLLSPPETMAGKLPPDAPELFELAHACTSSNALHRARAAEDEAFAKSERAVFAKQDGVTAGQLFDEAEACYRQANDAAGAEFVAARGLALRTELQEEYKLLRMRLGRALRESTPGIARRQLRQLLALLKHRNQHSFVLSLKRLDLRLSRKELPK
jgi:hypothetical protein